MKEKDEVFKDIRNNTVKNVGEEVFGSNPSPIGGGKGGFWGTNYILLGLIGIFVFAGAEAVKAIFRKNYTYGKYSKVRLVLCFILFGIFGAISFYQSIAESEFVKSLGSPTSFIITSILCGLFGLFILIKGLADVNKAVKLSNRGLSENGDSTLLSFLIEKDGNQNFVQNVAEPILIILIGGVLTLYNIILGLPFVFCGLSVWIEKLIMLIFGNSEVQDTVKQKGYNSNERESYSESN